MRIEYKLAAIAGVGAGILTHDILKKRAQRKHLEQRLITHKENIEAIRDAYNTLIQKINNGEYRHRSLDDLHTDFEFEIIVAHEKKS